MSHSPSPELSAIPATPEPGWAPPWLKRLGLLTLVSLPIVGAIVGSFPLCPTAAFAGIPCPGCGLTRASIAAIHGDTARAFQLHPLVFVVAPLYLWVVLDSVVAFVRGRRTRTGAHAAAGVRGWYARLDRLMGPLAAAAMALLLVLWIARFLGFLGGPVPVTTLREWHTQRVEGTR